MTPVRMLALLLTLVVIATGNTAQAQIPDEFKNLKVLPEDISKRELVDIMREFATGLGVRCLHCHIGKNPNSLEGYDFVSDDKETKRVSREMMKMVHEINNAYLPATEREKLTRVRCVTCHRGLENPETLDRILVKKAVDNGAPAAIDRYRQLREKYHGSGSYNFGVQTLNAVAERLAQEHDNVDGAIEMAELNVEFHPEDASVHMLLGQLYLSSGNKDAAIASMERAVELEPDNKWAKRMLERARASE